MTTTAQRNRAVVREAVRTQGTTYAEEAGIRLADTPQPLYRLLVLSALLSARIRATIAVDAARELSAAGMRGPRAMKDADWQQRVDALGRGGYRRYDESTATRLGKAAALVDEEYGGDLRRMHREADGDPAALRRLLRKVPGIGPTGAEIFLREAQDVWEDVAPVIDGKAQQGAARLDLPQDPDDLLALAPRGTPPARLAAALVRVALDKGAARECLERAEA